MPAVILKYPMSEGKNMSADKFIPSGQLCYQTAHTGPLLNTQHIKYVCLSFMFFIH